MSRKERRRMQREDQPNTRQLCSKNRMEEFHSRYPPLNAATPPSLLSFSLPVFSRSYVIPDPCWPPAFPKQLGQIQTSPNTHFDRAYIHTQHAFISYRLGNTWVDSAQLVPGTNQAGDSPPCALRRCSSVGVLEMFGLHGTGSILLPFIVTNWGYTHNTTIQSREIAMWRGVGEPRPKKRGAGRVLPHAV